jgi:hypothetical protein
MRPFLVLVRRFDALVRHLGTRRAERLTLAVATALAATSVGPHRVLDDFVLGLIARGKGAAVGLERGGLDLFTFTTGDPAGNHRLMDVGLMLPWWTDDHLRIAFFRPVASATHWLDERLWPGSAILMHAHSLAWFVALLGAVALLYRRLEGSPVVAGLALLLYAIDDAHGQALAWLANRNALIATTFGCLALVLHDAWRREKRPAAGVLAGVAFVVGLLAGEIAIGALGYLVAYAVLFDRDRPVRRALSLAPYAVVVVTWRGLWSRGGYGAKGSGAYLDPLSDPVRFLTALPQKLVVLFHGQFSAPPSDVAFLAPPVHQPFIVALAVVTCLVVVWLLLPILRSDPGSRFWALGMGLALLPLGATFPSDRLLLFVGLGAMALLARLFGEWFARGARGELPLDARAILTGGLIVMHLVAAPLALPVRAGLMELFGVAHARAARGIPSDPSVASRTVVIVAAPTVLFANYIQGARELEGIPRPAHLYILASASSPIEVERTGAAALTLRPARGFLYTPQEQHYRGAASMEVGDRVALSAMAAEVVSRGGDGRPAAVEFSFDRPPSEYLFLKWQEGRFVPFELPPLGHSETLPEEDFGKILMETALRGI